MNHSIGGTAGARPCGPARLATSRNPLLGLSIPTLGVAVFADFIAGVNEFQHKAGITNKVQVVVNNGSAQTQIEQVQAFVSKAGAENGLLYMSTTNTEAVPELVQICEKAKVYFITQPNKPTNMHPGSSKYWVAHIAYDYPDYAAVLMDLMVKKSGAGDYVILGGDPASAYTPAASAVLKAYAAKHPQVHIVANEDITGYSTTLAFTTMSTILTKNSNLAGVWCGNDDIALGAIKALQQAGKSGVPVTGYDADPAMVADIMAGSALGSAAAKSAALTFFGFALAWATMQGEIDPLSLPINERQMEPEYLLVTKSNAATYKKDYINSTPSYSLSRNELFYLATKGTSAYLPG